MSLPFAFNFDHVGALFSAIPLSFMAIFPVLNPLGSAFIILSLTTGMNSSDYALLCKKIAWNSFFLFMSVFFLGTYVLEFFGISVAIVQVGGGMVIAYIGWNLLNHPSSNATKDNAAENTNDHHIMDKAFYPLTMPITCGPGCMAVTLTISAHERSAHHLATILFSYMGVVISIILLSASVYFCYRYAEKITHRLGNSGTNIIIQISSFINFCIGLEIAWKGLQALLGSS